MSVTTAAPTAPTTATGTSARRRPATVRALGIAGAVVGGLVAWGIGAVLGADYWIADSQGAARIDVLVTVQVTVILGLLGWALLAAAERVWRHARTAWTVLGTAILAASMVPVFLVDATTSTRIGLVLVHLAVGAVLLATFPLPRTRR